MQLATTIECLFAGGIGYLDIEGQRSGIFKRRAAGPVRVEAEGIVGDEQADRRVHGGPEKAVHHYAAQHYQHLAETFPEAAYALIPGSLGENISACKLSESNVHIGDIFQVGNTVLQVSQPRSPCWKINYRFGVERMSMYIAQWRITGWYYRVLRPGIIEAGDSIVLVERQTEYFSIDQFWQVQLSREPNLGDLATLSEVRGLAPDWKRRLRERAKWLRIRLAASI
jgi:MOSC domain-containing protein YiiM